MSDVKIEMTAEMAAAEFLRFAENARLDFEKPRNENDKRALDEDRQLFEHFVRKGIILVDDEGYPSVKTESELLPLVKFTRRPKVSALRAMDKCKQTNDNGKMLAMMADTLGIPSVHLNDLSMTDFEAVSLVFGLFLG